MEIRDITTSSQEEKKNNTMKVNETEIMNDKKSKVLIEAGNHPMFLSPFLVKEYASEDKNTKKKRS